MSVEPLTQIKAIIADRGGALVQEPEDKTLLLERLRIRCENGHVWNVFAGSVIAGKWCPKCAYGCHSISFVRSVAEKQGGACLSDTYSGIAEKLSWKCKRGHIWRASFDSISRGNWCKECTRIERGEKNRELLMLAVTAREGKIVSLCDTSNLKLKHKFLCKNGHEFSTTGRALVDLGTWCRKCGRISLMNSEKDVRALAKARGGRLLSSYQGVRTKLEWECAEGHRFWLISPSVARGRWCPYCTGMKRITLGKAQELAKSRKGECLSESVESVETLLRWRCHKGHEWDTSPHRIQRGTWCPHCAGKAPGTIEKMQAYAAQFGGECVSASYEGNKAALKWRCRRGHAWRESYNSVSRVVSRGKRSEWCPKCAVEFSQ